MNTDTTNRTPSGRDWRMAVWLLLALVPGLFVWRLAASFITTAGLFVDEAQYWDWSQELAWGYFSKPPVLASLIRLSTEIAGDSLAGVRWLVVLLWTLTPVVLWRLVWEMVRDRAPDLPVHDRLLTGAWAAVLASSMLIFAFIGQVATTDGPLLFFWSLLMWLFWRLQHQATPSWWWGIWGAILALAILSKYTAVVAVASAVWLTFRRGHAREWRGLFLAIIVCTVLLVPHLLWNQAHDWPSVRHTAEILAVRDAHHQAGYLMSAANYLLSQSAIVGPVVLVMIIQWAVRKALQKERSVFWVAAAQNSYASALTWAWAWAWPVWLIGGLQAMQGKSQMNWPAPAVLGLALILAIWRSSLPKLQWRGTWLVLMMGTFVGGAISLGGDWRNHLGMLSTGPKWDLWSRAKGWDTALEAMVPYVKAVPEARVVANQRAVIAHAAYAWRAYGWHPQALPAQEKPANHYELFYALDPESMAQQGTPLLWLSTDPKLPDLPYLKSFSPPRLVHSHAFKGRTMYLWRLDPR